MGGGGGGLWSAFTAFTTVTALSNPGYQYIVPVVHICVRDTYVIGNSSYDNRILGHWTTEKPRS